MSDSEQRNPIPDPASQRSGAEDTSIVPDPTVDPAEVERERTDALDDDED